MVDVLVFHELVGQSPRMRPMRIWRWRSRPEAENSSARASAQTAVTLNPVTQKSVQTLISPRPV